MANRVSAFVFDPVELFSPAQIGAPAKFRRNAKIFRQGEPADAVFFVVSGQIKLTVASSQGREAVIAILGKGAFFGEGCLVAQERRIATAMSFGESEVIRIPRAILLQMLRDQPVVAEKFVNHLLTRAARVEADLIDHMFNSSERRLARTLLLLANFGKEQAPDTISLKISQETLAEMIGTTRSRVSYFMNKFRKLGFVSYNGGIEVHNSLLNVVLAEPPERMSTKARK